MPEPTKDNWRDELDWLMRDAHAPRMRCTFSGSYLEPPEYEDDPRFTADLRTLTSRIELVGVALAEVAQADLVEGVLDLDSAELWEFITAAAQEYLTADASCLVTTRDLSNHLDKLKPILAARMALKQACAAAGL